MVWVQERINKDLNNIYPQSIDILKNIDTIPHDKALRITAYLWEGCFQSTNELWIYLCGGLLYRLPEKWILANIENILSVIEINWEDDFEYYNLFPVFYHIPEIADKVFEYALKKIPESAVKDEWAVDIRESIGSREYYKIFSDGFNRIYEE